MYIINYNNSIIYLFIISFHYINFIYYYLLLTDSI